MKRRGGVFLTTGLMTLGCATLLSMPARESRPSARAVSDVHVRRARSASAPNDIGVTTARELRAGQGATTRAHLETRAVNTERSVP